MGQSLNKKVAAYFVAWVAVQRAIAPRRTSTLLKRIWGETSAPVIVRSRRVFSFDLVGETLEAFGCHSTLGEWIDEALGNRFSLPLYFYEIAKADPARKALRYPRRMVRKEVDSKLSPEQLDIPLEDAPEHLQPKVVLNRSWQTLRTEQDPDQRLTAYGHLFTHARRRGNAPVAASLALHALQDLRCATSWFRARFFQRLHFLPFVRLEQDPCLALLAMSRSAFRDDLEGVGSVYANKSHFLFTIGRLSQARTAAEIAIGLLPDSAVLYQLNLAYLLARFSLLEQDQTEANRQIARYTSLVPSVPPPMRKKVHHTLAFLHVQLDLANSRYRSGLKRLNRLLQAESGDISFRVASLLDKATCAVEIGDESSLHEALSDLRTIAIARPVTMPPYFWAVVEEAIRMDDRRAASYARLAARLLQPGAQAALSR